MRRLEGTELEIPSRFAWDFFQTAPWDQRIDFLKGDEGILLGGMHPALLMVRSSLPGAKAVGRVHRAGKLVAETLPLWGDTLLIDTDQQICSIVWRGNGRVEENELRSLRVEVGLELPDSPLVFPLEVASTVVTPGQSEASPNLSARLPSAKIPDIKLQENPLAGTMTGPLQVAQSPILPFATKPASAVSEARLPSAKVPDIKPKEHPLAGTMTGPLQAAQSPALPFATKPASVVSEARLPAVVVPDIKLQEEEHPLAGTMTGPLQVVQSPVLPFATKPASAASEARSVEPPQVPAGRSPATPFEGALFKPPPPLSELAINQTVPLAPFLPDSSYRPSDVPASEEPDTLAPLPSVPEPYRVDVVEAPSPMLTARGEPAQDIASAAPPPSPEPPKTLGAHFLAAMERAARPVQEARRS